MGQVRYFNLYSLKVKFKFELCSFSLLAIHYFNCLKIVEILKETEANSKNIFGMYSSQRMTDWNSIVTLYQKNSIYLAETASILQRNVAFEIPALKKHIHKCQQQQTVMKRI